MTPDATFRRIAVVSDMHELQTAIRDWVENGLKVSRETVDSVSGLQSGYAGKLLAPVPSKSFGRTSLGLILGATGLELHVCVNEEKLAKLRDRLTRANDTGARAQLTAGKLAPIVFKLTRRRLKKSGQLGGIARAQKLSSARRISIARKAGKARHAKKLPARAA